MWKNLNKTRVPSLKSSVWLIDFAHQIYTRVHALHHARHLLFYILGCCCETKAKKLHNMEESRTFLLSGNRGKIGENHRK